MSKNWTLGFLVVKSFKLVTKLNIHVAAFLGVFDINLLIFIRTSKSNKTEKF